MTLAICSCCMAARTINGLKLLKKAKSLPVIALNFVLTVSYSSGVKIWSMRSPSFAIKAVNNFGLIRSDASNSVAKASDFSKHTITESLKLNALFPLPILYLTHSKCGKYNPSTKSSLIPCYSIVRNLNSFKKLIHLGKLFLPPDSTKLILICNF